MTKKYNDVIPAHESLNIKSMELDENRVINVWLPPSYNSSNDSFPVLYMPDGGLNEDFPHIANTLAELILKNEIQPIILVGIENTIRKRDLTGPTEIENDKKIAPEGGGSANFRTFINAELIPVINKKYKTTTKKGIIGESLAGLFVMETFLLNPDNFNFYIAFDPSLWWNNHYLDYHVEDYLKNISNTNRPVIWFASSSAGGMSTATQNIANAMENIPSTKLTWKYSNEPKEKHNTIFRACKVKALIWALNAN